MTIAIMVAEDEILEGHETLTVTLTDVVPEAGNGQAGERPDKPPPPSPTRARIRLAWKRT